MKGMNNILMLAIVGAGAYYFIIKKDVLGIMAAGGGASDDVGAAPMLPSAPSGDPSIPGSTMYPPGTGGFYKGIEYPNLSAVFPGKPGVDYRPPAFRTNEELIGGGFFGLPPGTGSLDPTLLPGQVLANATTISGVTVPAGYVFVGTDPSGKMIFEEAKNDPVLPPDMAVGTVAVINTMLPNIDVITYINLDGHHKEIKRPPLRTKPLTRGIIVRVTKKSGKKICIQKAKCSGGNCNIKQTGCSSSQSITQKQSNYVVRAV